MLQSLGSIARRLPAKMSQKYRASYDVAKQSGGSFPLCQETHKALENQGLSHFVAHSDEWWQDRQATRQGFEP
jgi:hypothetical protein